jgi:putative FmdB family regulatory protein
MAEQIKRRMKFMPIHDYKCRKCGKEFEKLVKSSEEEVVCEKCGSDDIEKQLSVFSASVSSSAKKSCSVSECSSCCPGGSCGL